MKTLLVSLLLGLTFLFPSETATPSALSTASNATEELAEDAARTTIYVRFGRRKKNCRGFGICAAAVSHTNNRGTRTTVVFSGKSIRYLRWSKKDVSKENQAKYFRDGTFVMEEDFTETLLIDGEKKVMSLKAGKYKLKEDKEGFLLEVSG